MKSAVTSWRGQSMEEEELDRLLEELLEKNKDRLVDAVGSWIGTTLGTWLFKLGTYLVFGKAFTPLNYASSAVILRQRYSVDRFTPVTPECSVGSQLISTADDSSASAVIAEQTEEDPILLEKTLLILNPDRIPVPHAEPAPGFQLLLPPTHKPSPESGDEIPK